MNFASILRTILYRTTLDDCLCKVLARGFAFNDKLEGMLNLKKFRYTESEPYGKAFNRGS